jgi:hypothetical protein
LVDDEVIAWQPLPEEYIEEIKWIILMKL